MLTDRQVKALKPREREYTVSDDTKQRGQGRLALRVRPNGTKEWLFRYYIDGRKRRLSLGAYPAVSLVAARQDAQRYAGELGNGHDPADVARRDKEVLAEARASSYGTLGELMDAYVDDMKARGRRSADDTKTKIHRYVKRPFPRLWNTPARDITTADCRDMLSHHMQCGLTTTTNRMRSWLHAAFHFGLTAENDPRRHSSTSWGLTGNPLASIPRQGDWERQGQTVMSKEDVRDAWHNLPRMRSRSNLSVMAVRLCLATAGQRITALLRLEPQHLDFDRGLIDMPAGITKNEMPHVVPMSRQAREVLRPLVLDCERLGHRFIFYNRRDGQRPMLEDSVASLVGGYRKAFDASPWTVRDIRRTAKTVLGTLKVSKEDRDRLHGHARNDVSSLHYDRYDYLDEKTRAMKVWEKWLAECIGE